MKKNIITIITIITTLTACSKDDAPFDKQEELNSTESTIFLMYPPASSTNISLESLDEKTVSVRVVSMFYDDTENTMLTNSIEEHIKLIDKDGNIIQSDYNLEYKPGRPYYDIEVVPTQGWTDGDYEIRIKDPKKSNAETSYYFSTLSKPELISVDFHQKDNATIIELKTSEPVSFKTDDQICLNNDCVSANNNAFAFSQTDLTQSHILKVPSTIKNTSDELKTLKIKTVSHTQDMNNIYINIEPSNSVQCNQDTYCYQ